MKTAKKFLMMIAAATISFNAFSQSNEQGTIQVGLGWLATLGGGTIESTDTSGTTESEVTGVRGSYGLRAQYGLSENLSAGVFVRFEAATYIPTEIDIFTGNSLSITYSGTSFGLEGKYYVANSDNFNFYPAVTVGYTTATNSIAGFTIGQEYTISGLNYSVGVGLNWYFVSEVFGLSFDIGYAGSSLSGTQPADSFTPETEYTLTNGSITWGLGLTAHFGGN